MSEEFLALRNKLHKRAFRFDLSNSLWKAHYLPSTNMDGSNLVQVEKNGVLEGYALYELRVDKDIKAYRILEICASSREVQSRLVDQIISRGVENGIDFIFTRKGEEPLDVVFDEKRFASFVDCVIMSALLNPHELLLSVSDYVNHGRLLGLDIQGFDRVCVRVGPAKIEVVEGVKPEVIMKTDCKTFLKLFFGRTSLLKEVLKRNIRINSVFRILTVARFVSSIKQEQLYLPLGDWV